MATKDDDDKPIFINRPLPKEYPIPYTPPPAPANPTIRGLPLYYLSQLVASSTWIQHLLWSNAGFGGLRDHEHLKDVDPRYEPTVIKSSGRKYVPREDYLVALGGPEVWKGKVPQEGKGGYESILSYHRAFASGGVTPTQVAEALLPLVRRDVKTPTKHSVAFLETKVEKVREAAKASTERYARGQALGVLDGVPFAVKDEADLDGYAKCSGSKMDFTRKEGGTSWCVQRLLEGGGVCLGKTTMHELGLDTTNINPNHGTPLNPYNASYYTGGSSGGSAYAVAAGLTPFTVGHDGGGSIRIPANYCGMYGLKPSHGRISSRPSSNLAKSTAVPGPIAANMVDLEIAYRVMAEPDPEDADSSLFVPPGPTRDSGTEHKRPKLGIFKPWFELADEEVRSACWEAVEYLRDKLGYEVIDIHLPLTHEGQMAHAMTILAEVSSGIPSIAPLTPPNKVLALMGKTSSALDLLQAQKLRHLLLQHLSHLFSLHPGLIIVTPTTPNAGWKSHPGDLKYGCSDGNKQVRNMTYAWLANFTGCPALSAPVKFLDVPGGKVPVGVMGMGEWGDEEGCVGWGYDVERYLHQAGEGRERAGGAVDVFGLVEEAQRK